MNNSKAFSHINTYAQRPPLRLPPIAEEPRLHRRGRAHARARHRRQYGGSIPRSASFGISVLGFGSLKDVTMKTLAVLLVLMTPLVTVTAGPAPGPLRVCKENPRYFTDGRGKAIYLTGIEYEDILRE